MSVARRYMGIRLANRATATANYGTYGGNSWTRAGSAPGGSDTILVNTMEYDAAGNLWKTFDPKGIEGRGEFDALRRMTKSVQACDDGTPDAANDKTITYSYDGSNHLASRASPPASYGDGKIDSLDFVAFRLRFNASL